MFDKDTWTWLQLQLSGNAQELKKLWTEEISSNQEAQTRTEKTIICADDIYEIVKKQDNISLFKEHMDSSNDMSHRWHSCLSCRSLLLQTLRDINKDNDKRKEVKLEQIKYKSSWWLIPTPRNGVFVITQASRQRIEALVAFATLHFMKVQSPIISFIKLSTPKFIFLLSFFW